MKKNGHQSGIFYCFGYYSSYELFITSICILS